LMPADVSNSFMRPPGVVSYRARTVYWVPTDPYGKD
jgi:hypothetical protein